MKKELEKRFLATVVFLTLINLLRLAAGRWHWYLLFFWFGGGLGTILVDLDHWLYLLLVYPQAQTSQQIKKLVGQKQYRPAYELLWQTSSQRVKLAFRNVLFQALLIVFCFWALTSTGNWLGKGMVMTLYLQLLREQLQMIFKNQDKLLHRRLFWLTELQVSAKNQKLLIALSAIVFVGLSVLLV